MKLKKSDRIVRWAYLLEDTGPPSRASLCTIFWRAILITPLKLAALVAIASLLSYAAYAAYRLARFGGLLVWRHPLGLVSIALMILAGYCAAGYIDRWPCRRRPSALVAGAKAVKDKVCPLVEIS